MRVAVLFSGGKDSSQAVKWALDNGHEVVALISVKPKSDEAYLWHYATVEWTLLQASAMGIPLIMVKADRVGAREEAEEIEKVLRRLDVEALILGGVGLQETQIKEVKRVAKEFGIEVIVPYENYTSEELLEEEVKSGFEIMITQVASDGLGPEWLGRRITEETLEELKRISKKFGMDVLGEGGYYDTLTLDGPIFKKRIEVSGFHKVWDERTSSGRLEITSARLVPK